MTSAPQPDPTPDVLGEPVEARRAWRSSDFSNVDDVVTRLTDRELEDLENVAAKLPDDCSDWIDLPLEKMTTTALDTRLRHVAHEIGRGRGFAVIRGLGASDPERFRRMFWILGNHIGTPVMQNGRGEILSEVFDRFAGAPRGIDSRGYESNDELRFHCDGGDTIGLGCVRPSPSGGESGLVSLLAIYNEIVAHHPEHLAALYRGFPLYIRKEAVGDGSSMRESSVVDRSIPVFASHNGCLSAWVNMVLAEHAAEASGQPMNDASRAALDCLEAIAERPDVKLRFTLEAGDVMWVHNLSVMHRRDRYDDDADPSKQRLFYRMWANLHEPRDLVSEHRALRVGIPGPSPVIVGPGYQRARRG